jgi:hypothetical protein
MNKLKEFLTWNRACIEGIEGLDRLAATGAATPEEAWIRADARGLVWAVTRPGVMSPEQRRQFLVFVLESIEDKLTDPRSKNILDKLRTKSHITDNDKKAAWDASETAAYAYAVDAWAAARAADALAAARAARAAALAAAYVYAAAALAAARAAAYAAEAWADAAAEAAAREKQAQWIRDNFVLTDLNIN